MWQNHTVGLGSRQADTHRLEEGVNILLTSRISRIRETRVRELDDETRKVASCERHWHLILASGHTNKVLTEKEP
jgi:hypothetical protein